MHREITARGPSLIQHINKKKCFLNTCISDPLLVVGPIYEFEGKGKFHHRHAQIITMFGYIFMEFYFLNSDISMNSNSWQSDTFYHIKLISCSFLFNLTEFESVQCYSRYFYNLVWSFEWVCENGGSIPDTCCIPTLGQHRLKCTCITYFFEKTMEQCISSDPPWPNMLNGEMLRCAKVHVIVGPIYVYEKTCWSNWLFKQ